MDPNDPRRRLQALQQSNPSLRQQAAPKPVRTTTLYGNDGPKQVQVFSTDNSNFRTAAESARIDAETAKTQPQKQAYRGITLGDKKAKTIFGKPISWLGTTRSVTASGDITDTADNFLKLFDNTSEEARRIYVNQLKDQAQNDETAARTYKLLGDSGRFKGNLGDFAAGFNEKLGGGLVRGAARGADFLLPGHNTFGLEKFADQMEGPKQYTQAGKIGEKSGSIAKGITDVAGIVAGSTAAETAAGKVSAYKNLIDKLGKGGKVAKIVGKAIGVIPGSIAGSAVQSVEDAGKGEKQNVGKNVAIGLAADVGLGVFGKGLTALKNKKALSKLVNSNDEKIISSQIKKMLPKADEQTVADAARFIANEKDPEAIKAALDSIQPSAGEAAVKAAQTENGAKIDAPTNPTETLKDANTNVPRSDTKPFTGAIDETTASKIDDLVKAAESTPRPEGTVRVFQAAGDGASTDYVFDNVDSLAAFKNNTTSQTDNFAFKDVPAKNLKDGKAPGVYQVVEDAKAAKPVTETQKAAEAVQAMPEVTGGEGVQAATQEATSIGDTVATNADNAVSGVQKAADILPADASPEAHKAVQEILDSLNKAESSYADVTKVRAAEKAQRAAQAEAAYQAAGGGEAGMRAKLAALRGKYAESGFSPISASQEAQDAILNDIASSDLRAFEKTNTQNAIRKIWGATEGKPTPSDIQYIRDYFGQEFGDAVEQAVKDGGSSWREKIGEIAGLPKSIMASYDLSGTLRQGGILASRFPKQAASAFKDEVKYFASEDAFKAGMAEIKGRSSYEAMVNAKLAVTGAEGLTGTEEQFVSNLAEKIPGFGKGVAASDRAYTGFLTKLRADVFDAITTGKNYTDDELRDIAKFINSASGRGELGQFLEKHSQTLSTALFSPRLWKSRLDMLNPVYYAKLSGPARKYALQTAGTFAAEASAVLSVAALAGAHVETDLRSSDFGKIKVGNTRYDILGGLQQNLVFAWREISGEKKNSETGDVTKFAKNPMDILQGKSSDEAGVQNGPLTPSRLSVASDMIQNKENPLLAAGQRILKGKDRGGNDVNPLTELAKLAIPLPISGAVQTASDLGNPTNPVDLAKGAAMNLPDAFGISSQTYGTVATKDKGKVQANGFPEYAGKITPDMVTDNNGKAILDDKGKPIKVKFPEGATALQKQAILDDKRNSALSDQYKRTMPAEDQALLNLSDDQLEGYVRTGRISQEKYNELQDVQQVIKNIKGVKVPDGIKSDEAYSFYEMYNGLNKRQQDEYLNGPADEPAVKITKLVNGKLPKGLQQLKPTNQLAKDYADFEKDMNTHNYSDIEKRNKTKSFYSSVYKGQQPQHIQDIYKEGGSEDLRSFIESGALTKEDLDAAIKLDNELYDAGLAGLKFSKKFRAAHGYGTPGSYESRSGSGAKTVRAGLSALIPNVGKQQASPQFSSRARTVGQKIPNSIPKSSGQSKKISIKL